LAYLPSPWTYVSSYTNSYIPIATKAGDKFTIGLDIFTRGGQSWEVSYDNNLITLEDNKLVFDSQHAQSAIWYLFKAVNLGNTRIIFTYQGASGFVGGQTIFDVAVEH
jgi:hypothetical protein